MPKPRPNYKPFNEAQRDVKCPSFNGVPEFVVRPRTNMTPQPYNYVLQNLPANSEDPALEQLIAMFQSVLDQDTVSVVWSDCHGNVDEALDILTSVATSAEPDKFHPVSYPELNVPKVVRPGTSTPASNPRPQPPVSVPVKPNNKPLNPQAASFHVPSVRENILAKLRNGTKVLVLMRGVPGSGKSTLAQQIKGPVGIVLSTDDFFLTEDGRYNYKRELLGRAHDWNRERCLEAIQKGINPVIIDNTNLEAWEMKPYVDMALDFGYGVEILEPETSWRNKARILAQKNNHGVPKEKIELMLEKLQVPIRASDLVKEAFQKRKALAIHKSVSAEPLKPAGIPPSSASYPNFTPQPVESEPWRTTGNSFVEPKPQRVKKWINNPSSAMSGSNGGEQRESKPNSTWGDGFCEPKPQRTKKWGESIPENSSSWSTEAELARKATYSLLDSGSGEWCASGTPTGKAEKELVAEKVDNSTQTQYSDYFDTQSDGTPAQILVAKPRAISLGNGSSHSSPEPGIRQKWTLEKGCNTEEIQEEPSLNNLASLQAWFPNNTPEDLADVLEKCGGDLIWAVNLLLDSGYEMVDTTPDFSAITAPELEVSDVLTASATGETLQEIPNEVPEKFEDLAGNPTDVECAEERKAKARLEAKQVKEELESAFLVSGVSERARRICGRDYDEFRACTIRKAREARETHVENQVAAIEAMYGAQSDSNLAGILGNERNFELPGVPALDQLGEMEEMVTFTMDPGMAEQLQYYCGTPPSLIDSNYQYWTPENLTLTIPKPLAQQLHMYWCASIPNPVVTPQDWDFAYDEEFAQYLSRMESEQFCTLQDVMDFEYAMQLAENDKFLGQVHKRGSMATKLSRQMLCETFPLVDPLALEAVFEAHLYNYDQTVAAVAASFNVAQSEPRQFQVHTAKSKPSEDERTNETEYVHRCARDLRAEALLYYQMKTEAMQKAQDQYRKGMKAAAAFYAEKGRRFNTLYKEANRQAAQVIVEESNASNDERTLDLHMLYVTEALAVLEAFLSQCNDSGTVLNIITGQGRHSVDGRAKIKPAVMEFLRSKNISFEHVNAGMLQVRLNRRGR